MKNSNDFTVSRKPRRVYPYKGHNLICACGARYQSPENSVIRNDHPVTKVAFPSGEDTPATLQVTQRRKGRKGVTETWVLFTN